jgi:SAM-dependent methyltransferase
MFNGFAVLSRESHSAYDLRGNGRDEMAGSADVQGNLWSQQPDLWAQTQETYFKPLYEAVFDRFGPLDGKTLLDIGCGSGLALMIAAERGADVQGIDAADGLIGLARNRLGDERLATGDMEFLPFPDGSYDLVTGFNSFQYAANRVHALIEAGRVAKPGAPICAAVWGDPDKCESAGYVAALGRLGPPAPMGAPGPWSLSAPGALEALFAEAGLTVMDQGEVTLAFLGPDEDSTVQGLMAPGPGILAIRHSGEEAVHAAVAESIRPYRQSDGSYILRNQFRFVIGRA